MIRNCVLYETQLLPSPIQVLQIALQHWLTGTTNQVSSQNNRCAQHKNLIQGYKPTTNVQAQSDIDVSCLAMCYHS